MDHPQFDEVVSKAWNQSFSGNPMFIVKKTSGY